jgi:hypothetical protein
MEHVTRPCLEPEDLVPFTIEVSRDNAESCGFGFVKGNEGLDLAVVLDWVQCVVQIQDTKDVKGVTKA